MMFKQYGTTESDIQKFIMETPNNILIDMGLEVNISARKFKEYDIDSHGRADVVMFNDSVDISISNKNETLELEAINITVIEIKSRKIDSEALLQIIRYGYGLKRMFEKTLKRRPVHINMILLGHSSVYKREILMLSNLINESMDLDHRLNLHMYNYILKNGSVIGFDYLSHE